MFAACNTGTATPRLESPKGSSCWESHRVTSTPASISDQSPKNFKSAGGCSKPQFEAPPNSSKPRHNPLNGAKRMQICGPINVTYTPGSTGDNWQASTISRGLIGRKWAITGEYGQQPGRQLAPMLHWQLPPAPSRRGFSCSATAKLPRPTTLATWGASTCIRSVWLQVCPLAC